MTDEELDEILCEECLESDNTHEPWCSEVTQHKLLHYSQLADPEIKHVWVNVYQIDRHFGGPEEGGWWYDVRYPMKSFLTPTSEVHKFLDLIRKEENYPPSRHRFSMAPQGDDYEVIVEYHPGHVSPEDKPHYE